MTGIEPLADTTWTRQPPNTLAGVALPGDWAFGTPGRRESAALTDACQSCWAFVEPAAVLDVPRHGRTDAYRAAAYRCRQCGGAWICCWWSKRAERRFAADRIPA